MKIKIDKRDSKFSLLVRERANNVCERCGVSGENAKLECSHIFSRRHRSIRWHPDNAQCLCFTCHKWWHDSPALSGVWIRDMLGDGYIDLLEEKKNTIVKYSKVVLEDLSKHLNAEYKRVLEVRKTQETGRIEFEAFD